MNSIAMMNERVWERKCGRTVGVRRAWTAKSEIPGREPCPERLVPLVSKAMFVPIIAVHSVRGVAPNRIDKGVMKSEGRRVKMIWYPRRYAGKIWVKKYHGRPREGVKVE